MAWAGVSNAMASPITNLFSPPNTKRHLRALSASAHNVDAASPKLATPKSAKKKMANKTKKGAAAETAAPIPESLIDSPMAIAGTAVELGPVSPGLGRPAAGWVCLGQTPPKKREELRVAPATRVPALPPPTPVATPDPAALDESVFVHESAASLVALDALDAAEAPPPARAFSAETLKALQAIEGLEIEEGEQALHEMLVERLAPTPIAESAAPAAPAPPAIETAPATEVVEMREYELEHRTTSFASQLASLALLASYLIIAALASAALFFPADGVARLRNPAEGAAAILGTSVGAPLVRMAAAAPHALARCAWIPTRCAVPL